MRDIDFQDVDVIEEESTGDKAEGGGQAAERAGEEVAGSGDSTGN